MINRFVADKPIYSFSGEGKGVTILTGADKNMKISSGANKHVKISSGADEHVAWRFCLVRIDTSITCQFRGFKSELTDHRRATNTEHM